MYLLLILCQLCKSIPTGRTINNLEIYFAPLQFVWPMSSGKKTSERNVDQPDISINQSNAVVIHSGESTCPEKRFLFFLCISWSMKSFCVQLVHLFLFPHPLGGEKKEEKVGLGPFWVYFFPSLSFPYLDWAFLRSPDRNLWIYRASSFLSFFVPHGGAKKERMEELLFFSFLHKMKIKGQGEKQGLDYSHKHVFLWTDLGCAILARENMSD